MCNIDRCKPYIENIGALSCREQAGVNLINRYFNLNAAHVIDPTLLMALEEWNHTIGTESRLVEGKYNLAYCFLGTKKGREKIFRQIENQKECKLVFLSGADGDYKKYMYQGSVGPFEFVHMYRDAEFVLTDTFHGMLFAIIFKKPFVVLAKEPFGVSADRLKYTLASLGLEDRYIQYNAVIDKKYLSLDYAPIIERLSKMREASMMYLKQALEKATDKD